jgi:hypothetical protein
MTKQEAVTKGNRLHEVMEMWMKGIMDVKNGYLLMGKALFHIEEEKLYKLTGNHVKTFSHFVKNELTISRAQAYRLIQIYKELGHLLQDISIDISKVTLLLPYLHGKTEGEREELLLMARNCTVEDIKNNIKDLKGEGELATDACLHTNTELINRCKDCGKYFK